MSPTQADRRYLRLPWPDASWRNNCVWLLIFGLEREFLADYEAGMSMRKLADKYGVSFVRAGWMVQELGGKVRSRGGANNPLGRRKAV